MKYLWFGTRERMSWVPCPAIEVDLSKVGWSANGQYLNGGSFVRRSATASKTYNFSWNMMSQGELRKVMDYFDGLYGQGPFYFIDPFAVDNILPQHWATPRLQAQDAPSLVKGKRPVEVDTVFDTWESTPDASPSVRWISGVEARRNMINDPRGTNIGWWRVSPGETLTSVTDGGLPAIRALDVLGGGQIYADPIVPRAVNGYTGSYTGVNPGEHIRYSVEIKPLDPSYASAMRVRFATYGGAVLTNTDSPTGIPADTWTRITIEAVVTDAPSGAYIRPMVWPHSTSIPNSGFLMRRAVLEISPTPLPEENNPYFDGYTKAAPSRHYPSKSAHYDLTAEDTFRSIWLPVPEGYTLHLGAHGAATGMAAITATRDDDGSTTNLTLLPVDTPTLTNHPVQGPTGVTLTGYTSDPGPTISRTNLALRPLATGSIGPAQAPGAVSSNTNQSYPLISGQPWQRFTWHTAQSFASGADVLRGVNQNTLLCTEGTKVAFSLDVMSSVSFPVRLVAQWLDAGGIGKGSTLGVDTVLVPNSLTRLSVFGTTPAGATHVRWDLDTSASYTAPSGASLTVNNLLMELGTDEIRPFFSGNSPSSDALSYTWAGEENNSVSLETFDPGPGSLTLSGLVAAIRPTGEPAPTGDFVSGQGHSGCQFADRPSEEGYSAALDLKGSAVTLIETGAWD